MSGACWELCHWLLSWKQSWRFNLVDPRVYIWMGYCSPTVQNKNHRILMDPCHSRFVWHLSDFTHPRPAINLFLFVCLRYISGIYFVYVLAVFHWRGWCCRSSSWEPWPVLEVRAWGHSGCCRVLQHKATYCQPCVWHRPWPIAILSMSGGIWWQHC